MKHLLTVAVFLLALTCCTSEADRIRMRAGLDSINMRNRNDQPFTVSDVQPYVTFFDEHGTPNDRLLANYLLGRAYYDQGEAPMALKCYQDAIECADTTASDCDYVQLARVYGQMSQIFYDQGLFSKALSHDKISVGYAWKGRDTLLALRNYEQEFFEYNELGLMDSAIMVVNDVAEKFKQYGEITNYAISLGLIIKPLIAKGDFQKAKINIEKYESLSGFFDSKGNIKSGREIYYKVKGLYYLHTNKLDSAEHYFRKELREGKDFNNQNAGAIGMIKLYQRLYQPDSVAKYSLYAYAMSDSLYARKRTKDVERIHALYNYEEHERIAAKKTIEAERYKQAAIILIVILSITGYTTYRYFRRQKQKQRNELRIANTAYSDLLSQYHQVNTDLENSRQSLENYHKEKEDELDILKERLAEYQVEATVVERWTSEQTMLHSTIVNQLHQLASQVVVPTNAQWQEFRRFAEEHLTDFYQHINRHDLELTDQEILVCILTRLQFIPTEQAALLDVSKQRITNLRSSINQKLFDEKSSKTLEKNILNSCS